MRFFSSFKHIIFALIIFLVSILGTMGLSFYNKQQLSKFSDNSRENIDWAYFQIERLFYPIHSSFKENKVNPDDLSISYQLWVSSVNNIHGPAFQFLIDYFPSDSTEDFINSMPQQFNKIETHIKNIDRLNNKNKSEWSNEATHYLQIHNNEIFADTQTLSLIANQKVALYWSDKSKLFEKLEIVENIFLVFAILCFLIFGALLLHYIFKIKKTTDKLLESNQLLTLSRDETLAVYQSKTMFLAKISHELKTPLNSILGFSDVLENDTDNPLNEEQRKNLKYVITASKMVSQLVHELLDFNSMESGKVDIHYSDFHLIDLIKESEEIVFKELQTNKNSLVYEYSDCIIYADFLRSKQILINLLTNAIKYGFPETVISISTEIKNEQIYISVENEGHSIPKEKHNMIFQPFFRGDYDHSKISGYGIGLSLIKKLSQLMNGDLNFFSENDKTVFTFNLPLSTVKENVLENQTLNQTLNEYVIIISQHQRFIDAILDRVKQYQNFEPLVVPDLAFAKDIIEYSDISHVIYTDGNMNSDFNNFISEKNIDAIKFDLDVESDGSVSVNGLDKLLQRWAL